MESSERTLESYDKAAPVDDVLLWGEYLMRRKGSMEGEKQGGSLSPDTYPDPLRDMVTSVTVEG